MGLGDMANKAKEALQQHPDQAKQGVEKAGDFVDEKTGGKYANQVDKGQEKLNQQFGGDDQQ